ncbi:hypothetical protein Hamer_G026993, partial [Homarus americanus]
DCCIEDVDVGVNGDKLLLVQCNPILWAPCPHLRPARTNFEQGTITVHGLGRLGCLIEMFGKR